MGWSLDDGLRALGSEALVVLAASSRDPDLAPFTGPAHLGEAFVVRPLGGEARLGYLTAMERDEAGSTGLALLHPADLGISRLRDRHGDAPRLWAELLIRALELTGLQATSVAIAGRPRLGRAHRALELLSAHGWSIEDGSALMLRHRKTKTAQQLAACRRAAAGICAALRRVAAVLAAAEVESGLLAVGGRPLTVGDLRRRIAMSLAEHGLDQPEGNIVAPGPVAAIPHSRGDDARQLRTGESIVVDLFPKGDVFADCTRTFCVGGAPQPLAEAHARVREALELARGEARPGGRGWDLHAGVCELFSAAGFETKISHPGTETGYVHGLGHGVGFELHEYPSFARTSGEEGSIEIGDVLTLEPGLYDPHAGYGVRLEDLCVVGEAGLENLTPLPYDLDPRRWPPERSDSVGSAAGR